MTPRPAPSPLLRKAIGYIIPLVITVGLCIILYGRAGSLDIRKAVGRCDILLTAAFLSLNVLAMVFRAFRWRLQLRAIGLNPPAGDMVRSIFGTYAVNLVFPRLGEFWRCGYIARRARAPFSGVFGSMVADRLSDTLMVLLLALLACAVATRAMTTFAADSNLASGLHALIGSPWLWGAAVLLAVAVPAVMRSSNRLCVKLRGFLAATWRGFSAIFAMKGRGRWLLYTAAIWLSYFLSMMLSLMAFPDTASLIDGTRGLSCALVTFVFGSLAMAIPSNGGIGPWQLAIILSLTGIYGLPRDVALTFATINLGATTLLTILLGLGTFVSIAVTDNRRRG